MNITFSILHYQALDMTCKCVDSILRLKTKSGINKSIIIVDNNSPNGSGKELKTIYESVKEVYVVLAYSNLGFAKGNNLGYKYAKKNLNPSAIIVINNDIVIQQSDFINVLIDNIERADVIAPDIINLSGNHQNPMRIKAISKGEIERLLAYGRINSIMMKIPVANKMFLNLIKVLKNNRKGINQYWKEEKYGIIPHGAALIFSSNYIRNEDIAFIPDTFMFCEEDILYDYLQQKKYKILYLPNLHIVHYEDVATNISSNSEIEKRKFMFKHKINSLNILKQRR